MPGVLEWERTFALAPAPAGGDGDGARDWTARGGGGGCRRSVADGGGGGGCGGGSARRGASGGGGKGRRRSPSCGVPGGRRAKAPWWRGWWWTDGGGEVGGGGEDGGARRGRRRRGRGRRWRRRRGRRLRGTRPHGGGGARPAEVVERRRMWVRAAEVWARARARGGGGEGRRRGAAATWATAWWRGPGSRPRAACPESCRACSRRPLGRRAHARWRVVAARAARAVGSCCAQAPFPRGPLAGACLRHAARTACLGPRAPGWGTRLPPRHRTPSSACRAPSPRRTRCAELRLCSGAPVCVNPT